jgi:hypothetical protein
LKARYGAQDEVGTGLQWPGLSDYGPACTAGALLLKRASSGLYPRVAPSVDRIVLARRAAPPRLQSGSAANGDASLTAGWRGSGSEVRPGLARLVRPALWWRLRVQTQAGQDHLDHRPLKDGRDDLELAGPAGRAVLHTDVEHALEQPRQTDAARPRQGGLDLAFGGNCGLAGRLYLRGRPLGTTSARSLAFAANTAWNLISCSRNRGASAAIRRMNSSGLMTKRVVPSRDGVLRLISSRRATSSCTPARPTA